jgi:hypothetical protein
MQQFQKDVSDFFSKGQVTAELVLDIQTKGKSGKQTICYKPAIDNAANDMLINQAKDSIKKIARKELEQYAPDGNDPEAVVAHPIDAVMKSKGILTEKAIDLPRVDASLLLKLKYYQLIFRNSDTEELSTFTKAGKGKVLRKNALIGLILGTEVLSPMNSDILRIDSGVSCIAFDGRIIVIGKKAFESIFDLRKKYEEETTEVFDGLNKLSKFKIANLPQLQEACKKDIRKLRQVSVIAKNKAYASLTYGKVKKLNSTFGLGIEFNDKTKELTFTDISGMLRLLSEDCVVGAYSKNPYIAFSKKSAKTGSKAKKKPTK